MQFIIAHLDPKKSHLLGETVPVLDAAVDPLPYYFGSHALLAYEETFDHQLVDSLPEGVAGYMELLGELHFLGQKLAVLIFLGLDQAPEHLLGLKVERNGAGWI
jgi:hypothetical protein